MKAAIFWFSSVMRLKPPWLPGTTATSACRMRLPRARASCGVSMALRAPVISRTGTVIARSSSSVRTPGNFGSAW
jgi:hypothetical protein